MSDKLIQLWESTIKASLVKNLISPAITNSTPAASDPLVMAAKQRGPTGQQAPLDLLGQNTNGYASISNNTPLTSDPLVQASFQPMNGQASAQIQLQDAPFGYTQSTPYSQKQSETTLLFRGDKRPTNLVPPEGNLASNEFHGGNLYTPEGNNPLSRYAPIASSMPGSMLNSIDVFALAQYARNIAMEFGVIQRPGDTQGQRMKGVAKGAAFLASQVLLTTFNPADPQNGGPLNMIYNPLSFPSNLVPGIRGNAIGSPNVPAVLSIDGKAYQKAQGALPSSLDRHLLMRDGVYTKATNASDIANGNLINYPGFIGDLSKPGPTDMIGPRKIPMVDGVTIAGQVDQSGLVGKAAQNGPYSVNLYDSDHPYSSNMAIDNDWIENQLKSNPSQDPQQIILAKIFKPSMDGGITTPSLNSLISLVSAPKTNQYRWYSARQSGLATAKPSSYPSSYDAAFDTEGTNGLIDAGNDIADDSNYMPFCFQDLRDATPSLLYFRAFLKDGLSEMFQPNWQTDSYYGRVDEVPTYMNTIRQVQVAFDVVAWHPKDLSVIWTKLTKLQSMVYPTFDSNRYLQAGPLIRMRIGDLFTSHKDDNKKKGLPGYISTLNFDYDDNIWNITEEFKVPRKIAVSLTFVVIHEGNPGVYLDANGEGVFGTLEFRSNAPPPNQSALPAALSPLQGQSPIPSSAPTLGNVMPGGIRGLVDTIASDQKKTADSGLLGTIKSKIP